ncbi:cytochrome C [Stigmatella sp. ncwal1]|uniref:Cytochrome C n=1 Tax=Stigmatella ashevillensis TaxID=2995309 RepID=A0ABT5DDQ3_9BACT|nr:cytochrome C [Stigmatella ashevillena]MDC0710913.1 cytochrome C [Stigmatella ashevillena]
MRGTTAPTAAKGNAPASGASTLGVLLLALLTSVGCGGPEALSEGVSEGAGEAWAHGAQALSEGTAPRSSPQTALGVALEVEDGEPMPLRVRAGQSIYINQIDIRSSVAASKDEGLAGLVRTGDFAGLGWLGVKQVEQEFELLGSEEGYKRRRFYRNAAWMNLPSSFFVEPVDEYGRLTGLPILLNAGQNDKRQDTDDFFVRRFRAIQWTYDCPALQNCAGASNYLEEALLELRNARTQAKQKTLTLNSRTKALRLRWTLRPFSAYTIPVEQVAQPAYDYGFSMDVSPVTPPLKDGTYAPGTAIQFRLTLKDGSGKRLHPVGWLPAYNDVIFGENEAGIQYYRAFFDPTATYYRRKHRERMMIAQIMGPAQRIQPIRSIIDMEAFLAPETDVQTISTAARDGVFSQFRTFPPANQLFGGAFDPMHVGWAAPVSDTWSFQIPANAEPGTYLVTVKGRRVYLGEDIPYSKTVEIQVGTKQKTQPVLTTGPCNTCHSEGGELGTVLHGNDNRGACAACHAPLGFELEGPVFVRVHFIHSRSDRIGAAVAQCSKCHLAKESVQRASKAACLSCHTSYPKSHEQQFGPITSMYVGGGRESFQQCTSTCHTTHPQSGL